MIDAHEITRADALALLANRLRRHYGERLLGVYAIKDDPHEPSGHLDALFLVAVLREPFALFDEIAATSALTDQLNRELSGSLVTTVFPVSSSDFLQGDMGPATIAAREGVRL